MKQKVINYLESDRAFASGKQLYPTLPGKSLAFVNALNRMNNTPANCAKLHYELCKTVGITERHLGILLRKDINVVEGEKESNLKIIGASQNDDLIDQDKVFTYHPKELAEFLKSKEIDFSFAPKFEKGLPGMAARKQFVLDNDIKVEGKKAKDFDYAILRRSNEMLALEVQGYFKNETTTKFINSTELDKQSVKLHDQFPFLSEDDCPEVCLNLVDKMVTAFHKYKGAHPRLFEQLTAKERLEAAKDVIAPYKENKAIWGELEYYQANRKLLGEHPLVKEALWNANLKAMDDIPLSKLETKLKNSINKHKALLEKLDGKKAIDKTKLINAKEEELHKVVTELKSRK